MSILESLKTRRSQYELDENIKLNEAELITLIEDITEQVPDAFNMKSARVFVATKENHKKVWDVVAEKLEGKIPKEKIDSFKSGFGTILFFYDNGVVKSLQEQFEAYADNFPVWANQANGMLQISIWTALSEVGIGASVQHYNPIIDDTIKEIFNIPKDYVLVAQMPFGNIVGNPKEKEKENIKDRVVLI